jgi:thiol:disulfide interchange protein DsbD
MNMKNRIVLFVLLAVMVPAVYSFMVKADGAETKPDASTGAAVAESVPVQDDMPASVDEVITWSFKVEYGKGDEATLVFSVDQKDGWHVYSQHSPPGAVNEPTSFAFKATPAYELVGKVEESKTELRDNQGFQERFFGTHTATFKQKIRIKSKKDFTITGEYVFMACKQSCFPPEFREFSFKVKGFAGGIVMEVIDPAADTTTNPDTASAVIAGDEKAPFGWRFYAEKSGNNAYTLYAAPEEIEGWRVLKAMKEYQTQVEFTSNPAWKATSEMEFREWEEVSVAGEQSPFMAMPLDGGISQAIERTDTNFRVVKGKIRFVAATPDGKAVFAQEQEFEIDLSKARTVHQVSETKGSYWTIFLLAFGSGLLALLTPCVFPMIPLTVSFFTKSSTNRRKGIISGLTYGGSIFAIYVLLSVPFHLLDSLNPNILNEISTNVPLNIFFFLMLFVFGLSFLGAFEITMPSKWTNRVDGASNVGGFVGTFLMALTLALVSFSCTGPILGSLLAGASGGGGATALTAGMAGFGLALGLPFGLFAVFPGWLNSLPKSGGWLNSVKVVLGLLEIAFAFKFLSQADMVVQAHLLEREVFIAIWIGIFLTMALYLFGLFRTKHDSELKHGVNTLRVVLGVFSLAFTFYLVPGLWGAPLKLIGAFPPPQNYSEIPYGIMGEAPVAELEEDVCEGGEAGVHGLILFHDYDDALACAKEKNLPLMLDFTGYACVNCRLMEQNVWSHESVLPILKEKVVIASLYVDDRTKLPEPETSPDGKELTTYGDKWANMQKRLYKSSSQPQYILIDAGEEMLNGDASYQSHGNPSAFWEWLDQGLKEFKLRGETPPVYFIVSPV